MKRKRIVRDYFEAVIVAVLLALFVRTFLFEAFKIPTPSMERSLLVGDHIIVDKFGLAQRLPFEDGLLPLRSIHRGEVVVFKFEREPEKDYVKRVVGLPGDEVRVEDKKLFLNGQELREPYTQHRDPERVPERDFLPPVKVPPHHYFVMGDNRDNSADSREWGFVPRGQIRGRALFIYWSLAPTDPGHDAGPAAGTAASAGAAGALTKTRWERTFQAIRERSPSEYWLGSHCQRRGAGCKQPRRRRGTPSLRSGDDADGAAPPLGLTASRGGRIFPLRRGHRRREAGEDDEPFRSAGSHLHQDALLVRPPSVRRVHVLRVRSDLHRRL